jgi:hypothetical protein
MNHTSALAAGSLPYFVPFGKPFQDLFGPCRSTQAQLIQNGEIRSVLVGEKRGRRMIDTASYIEYLERQRRREAAGEIGGRSPNPRAARRAPGDTPVAALKTTSESTRKKAAASKPRAVERPQGGARPRQQYGSSSRRSS